MIGKTPLERIARHMVRAHATWCFILFLLIAMGATRPAQGEEKSLFLGFRQGKDSESIPEGWALISYLGTGGNQMSLLKENNRTVLHVKSLGSASGVLKNVKVDLKEFPILVWRWKINRVVGMAIERQRDRNDSTARIRVIFGKGGENEGEKPRPVSPQIEEFLKALGVKQTAREPAGFKIDYIWGNRIARGEVLDYPGSRNHKIVVVESGKAKANQWIWEKRNLVEDFELLFEAVPPGLSGIVILTDTDQTNEGVEAWYSSIVLMTE